VIESKAYGKEPAGLFPTPTAWVSKAAGAYEVSSAPDGEAEASFRRVRIDGQDTPST
jgi:hypothetical protein